MCYYKLCLTFVSIFINWSLCRFDFRQKRGIQRQSSSTSFTDHSEKSPMCKLTRISVSTETKLKSYTCFFRDQKGYTLDEKRPKRFLLHCVTSLKIDKMIRQCAVEISSAVSRAILKSVYQFGIPDSDPQTLKCWFLV